MIESNYSNTYNYLNKLRFYYIEFFIFYFLLLTHINYIHIKFGETGYHMGLMTLNL